MYFDYLSELCGFGSYERIIIFDFQGLLDDYFLTTICGKHGYKLIYYNDVEEFRYLYESEIKKNQGKYLVVLKSEIYLPYDIRCNFFCKVIDYKELFPRLNPYALKKSKIYDLNLLYIAHENLYTTIVSEAETKQFLSEDMFNPKNLNEFSEYLSGEIRELLDKDDYTSWCSLALLYAKLKYIRYRCNTGENKELEYKIQTKFKEFIIEGYSSLSGYSAYNGPNQHPTTQQLNRKDDIFYVRLQTITFTSLQASQLAHHYCSRTFIKLYQFDRLQSFDTCHLPSVLVYYP